MSNRNGLLPSIGVVSAVIILGQLLNLVQEMVIAAKFGTTWITDAYKMALVIPIILSIEAGSITNAITIPTFYEHREKTDDAEVFSIALNFFVLLALLVSVTIYLASPLLIELVAQGFATETKALATDLMRLTSFVVFLSIVSAFLANIMNAYKRFALPASQRIWIYGFVICTIFLFYRSIGIVSAAIGYLVGLSMFVMVQFGSIARNKVRYRLTFRFGNPVIKALVVLASPLILYSLLNQVNVFIEKRIVSGFEAGKLTALDIAFKMSVFFINFAVIGINTVLYPTISESFLAEDSQKIQDLFHKLLKAIFVLIIPLSVVFLCLQTPIVSLLFERGAFNQYSTTITATALMYYSLGLLGLAMTNTFPRFYQAFKKNDILLKIGAAAVVINIALIITLPRVFGYIGIPIAISLTATIHTVIFFVQIQRYIRVDYLDILKSLGKVLVAAAAFGATILLVNHYVEQLEIAPSLLSKIVQICMPLLLGSIVYLASCLVIKVEVVIELFRRVKHLMFEKK